MKIACVIPARLKSTRFPKKMLASLKGKPLLQWVWEAAHRTQCFDEIAFAIDSEEAAALVRSFGGTYHFTEESCKSGTDRLVELQERGAIKADIWVNWQGDEPFINKQMISDLLQSCKKEPSDVWTLKKRITSPHDISSPHIAKVVCDERGFALYFSRSVIPHYRDGCPSEDKKFFKHIGIYAFTAHALQQIKSLSPCELELAEQLEQLRFLYHGMKVRVHETRQEALGIDLPEHLILAERFLDGLAKSPHSFN
jgi:3-deoxy-manno-octulosonate cytidylyltransferase (CMP-KDO synthetase)